MNRTIGISVIVPTMHRAQQLERFILSLRSQSLLPDELIIVDASTDGKTQELIRHKQPQLGFPVHYLVNRPRLTEQRNLGFKHSSGNYLFFFDDDVVLDSHYIRVMLETFISMGDGCLGGLTGKIANIRPGETRLVKLLKRLFFLSDLGDGFIKPSGFASLRLGDEAGPVGFLSGCNMVIPREVFSRFLFDDKLPGYGYMDDVDISCRISSGYRLFYQPRAILHHHPSGCHQYDPRALRRMLVRHHRYLFKKNMPQDIRHCSCHWVSIVGLLIFNLFIFRDPRAVIGIAEGVIRPELC
jgi:GT2 family glycosyltransferase